MNNYIPSGRGMSHDISSNRFFLISSIGSCRRIWIGHNLIRYDNGNTKLDMGQIKLRIYRDYEDTLPHPQAVVMYARIYPGGFDVKTIRYVH
jgi:hypothetical protein